jgi:DNA-binding XRE family transcriptional regulator
MPIRRYQEDPRNRSQRRADEEVLHRFERGEFLRIAPSIERAAIEAVKRSRTERRQLAASLGVRLGLLRRAHGISQAQLARVLGTTKSNVSRLEAGRDGGLTVERLVAVQDAIASLVGPTAQTGRQEGLIHIEPLDRFRTAAKCLEVA